FTVNSNKCKLPNYPVFSEEVNLTYYPQSYTSCTGMGLLTYTTVENNVAYLHVREENVAYYSSGDTDGPTISCCYSYITRHGSEEDPDVGIRISSCQEFNGTERIYGETVMVKCFRRELLVYENVHNPITISTPVKQKLNRSSENNKELPISVLFIVIDSVSRLNFARTMPKTRNFLLRNDFMEYLGYNKIDDNTFPNFNALLTGLNLAQSLSICQPNIVGKLDECPMIWYDFRRLGYNPPTDYYFKPYIEAAETLNVTFKDTMPYCAGPETEDQPYFGMFWMNTFSHNYINSPSGMDEKVEQFFEDIHHGGILNSSVVILLSDHGIRFGNIRFTNQGWYEERLPVNFISIPPWFRSKYPSKYDNVKRNANKLVSTYDLYMTLQDMLKMSVRNYTVKPSRACPSCMSLFSEIPEDRSCQEAGIPEEWCTCLGRFNKNDQRITIDRNIEAANLALATIRKYAAYSIFVQNILSSSVAMASLNEGYYLIIFETTDFATYQALFRIKVEPLEFVKLVKIIRLWQQNQSKLFVQTNDERFDVFNREIVNMLIKVGSAMDNFNWRNNFWKITL
ncbi:hypothetical protein NQ317_013005, partial [Molorchus minor]